MRRGTTKNCARAGYADGSVPERRRHASEAEQARPRDQARPREQGHPAPSHSDGWGTRRGATVGVLHLVRTCQRCGNYFLCVSSQYDFRSFSLIIHSEAFFIHSRRLSSTIDAHIPTGMTLHMRTHRQAPHAHALYTSPSFHPRPTRVIRGRTARRVLRGSRP